MNGWSGPAATIESCGQKYGKNGNLKSIPLPDKTCFLWEKRFDGDTPKRDRPKMGRSLFYLIFIKAFCP